MNGGDRRRVAGWWRLFDDHRRWRRLGGARRCTKFDELPRENGRDGARRVVELEPALVELDLAAVVLDDDPETRADDEDLSLGHRNPNGIAADMVDIEERRPSAQMHDTAIDLEM